MPRFFMLGTNLSGGRAMIYGRDAEHIRVLRLRPGESLTVCDGMGTDYRCRLVRSDRDEAEAEVVEVDRRRIVLNVTAYDEVGVIGKGTHERFLIDAAKFLAKAEAKQA